MDVADADEPKPDGYGRLDGGPVEYGGTTDELEPEKPEFAGFGYGKDCMDCTGGRGLKGVGNWLFAGG